MAILHPEIFSRLRHDAGRFREQDVIDRLEQSLPDNYELFYKGNRILLLC